MTSTAWQSAALICIIALWAAMIAGVFGIIVGLIVAMAGNVRNSLHELCAYALARKAAAEFGRAVMANLSGKSEARIIEAQFARSVHRRGAGMDHRRRAINPADTGRKLPARKGFAAYQKGAGGLHSAT